MRGASSGGTLVIPKCAESAATRYKISWPRLQVVFAEDITRKSSPEKRQKSAATQRLHGATNVLSSRARVLLLLLPSPQYPFPFVILDAERSDAEGPVSFAWDRRSLLK